MPLIVPGIMQQPTKGERDEKQVASTTGGKNEKPHAQHFQANPGPVVPEDTTAFEASNTASREESEKRVKELNQ